jgi:paraquat-inducible protein A
MRAMSTRQIACLHCDLILALGDLAEGDRAGCPRCGHLLSARIPDSLNRALAFSIAAIVLLVMANAFPFLALQSSGLENVMTLPRAAVQIYRDGYGPMAFVVFSVIIVIPAVMLATINALLIPLVNEQKFKWLVPAGRLLFTLSAWSMVEVFVVGVVVSLVKIGSMATVVFGLSFWSYVAFAICFTAAMSSLDRLDVWERIERCTP